MRHHAAVALLSLTLGAGCKSLPEEVPYRAQIMRSDKASDDLSALVGAELLLDGEKVGTVRAGKHKFLVEADWKGPKGDVRAVLGGRYQLRIHGLCGPTELDAEGPNEVWRERSENDLAGDVEKDGYVPIFIHPEVPDPAVFLVNWGEGKHVVEVGAQKLKAGEKEQAISLAGCEEAPTVKVDGKAIGELDLKAKVHVISADPTRCHRLQEVSYGDHDGPVAAPIALNEQLGTLEEKPIWVFEHAPSSLQVYQGTKGTTVRELISVACPDKAE